MDGSGNSNGDNDGGGNGRNVTHALLERIARAVENTNERIDGLSTKVDTGFAEVNGRLDHMIQFMGTHHANHEQRITALEAEVFKKSG